MYMDYLFYNIFFFYFLTYILNEKRIQLQYWNYFIFIQNYLYGHLIETMKNFMSNWETVFYFLFSRNVVEKTSMELFKKKKKQINKDRKM